jgi:hypothetical protein
MKKLLMIILYFLSTCILIAQDIKLDELLKKYSQARGQEGFTKLKTLKITGKMSLGGMVEFHITSYKKYPDQDRTDWEFQGTRLISVIEGQTGWMINPIYGSFDPQDLSADMIKSAKKNYGMQNSPIDPWNNPFVNWKEKGNKIELVGMEDLNKTRVFNLKVTFIDGDVANYYLDIEKNEILKMKQRSTTDGQLVEVESLFSDFRNVDSFMIPFRLENLYNGNSVNVITVDKIEFNLTVDDSIFKKPVVNKK